MSNFEIVETIRFKKVAFGPIHLVKIMRSGSHIQVIQSPFLNCQIFSLSPFSALVFGRTDVSDINKELLEIAKLTKVGKRLCQIDVAYVYFLKVKEYINIHSQTDYINLTGSKMVQLLIKL